MTIVTEGRRNSFGAVVGGAMIPSPAGAMVEPWWREIEQQFPAVGCDAFVVMPNHVHGIAIIGARLPLVNLATIVGWFKTVTSSAYIDGVKLAGWPRFAARLWQRNYYEHVIRSDAKLDAIRRYVVDNPSKWAEDSENPERVRR